MSAAAGAAAGAAAAAALANATKASGVIVKLEPEAFQAVLRRVEEPLVIHAQGGFISTNYQYLVSYKGLAFYTKASKPLSLPPLTEIIRAKKIWIPD
jgi:hypothetical protein